MCFHHTNSTEENKPSQTWKVAGNNTKTKYPVLRKPNIYWDGHATLEMSEIFGYISYYLDKYCISWGL